MNTVDVLANSSFPPIPELTLLQPPLLSLFIKAVRTPLPLCHFVLEFVQISSHHVSALLSIQTSNLKSSECPLIRSRSPPSRPSLMPISLSQTIFSSSSSCSDTCGLSFTSSLATSSTSLLVAVRTLGTPPMMSLWSSPPSLPTRPPFCDAASQS